MTDRKNAVEVMQTGDAYIIGVGEYDGTNPTSATTVQNIINGKQDNIRDLEEIRRGASLGATAVQDSSYVHTDNNYTTEEKNKLANLENYDDKELREEISRVEEEMPTKTSELTNDSGFITNAALTSYSLITETGNKIELTLNESTYVMTLTLKDKNDNTLSTGSVDLPLETIIVSGRYDAATKKIILVLKNGTEISFSVADLVSGLQTEITPTNKLSSNLVDDTNSANKFVSTIEKSAWNAKAEVSDIPTKVSELTNDAGYITGYTETDPVFTASVAAGITSANITTWNNKSDFSGDYNDLINQPNIPTKTSDLTNDSNFVADANYVHTDNNYTGTEKTKLAGIEEGAQVNPDLTDYVKNTNYATIEKAGVIKAGNAWGQENGVATASTRTYEQYQTALSTTFIGKGTLENVITGKGLVSDTDYASDSSGGVVKTSINYGSTVGTAGVIKGTTRSYEQYQSIDNQLIISKGTLENVITGKELLNANDVKNNVTSTDTDKPLSANMGKELNDRIQNLASIGKYLAMWDCTTGLPTTNPVQMPYTYTTGDYYVISKIGTTNYMPNGSTYTGSASTTEYTDTETLNVGDFFHYDGTVWSLLKNTGKTVAFANIAGSPMDNSNLANVLNDKVGFTNYASTGTAGVIKTSNYWGVGTQQDTGNLYCQEKTYSDYLNAAGSMFMSKTTLENVITGKELENKVNDVLLGGASIVGEDKIARISVSTAYGTSYYGTNKVIGISKATDSEIDSKTSNYRPIVPANLDYAVRSVRPTTSTTNPTLLEINTIYDLGEQTSVVVQLPNGQLGDFIEISFISKTATTLNITSTYGMTDLDLTPEAGNSYNIYCEWGQIDTNVYGWKLAYFEAPIPTI